MKKLMYIFLVLSVLTGCKEKKTLSNEGNADSGN